MGTDQGNHTGKEETARNEQRRQDSGRAAPDRRRARTPGLRQPPRPEQPGSGAPSGPWEVGDLGKRGSITPSGGQGSGAGGLGTGSSAASGRMSDGTGSVAEPGGTTDERELANPAGPAEGTGDIISGGTAEAIEGKRTRRQGGRSGPRPDTRSGSRPDSPDDR